MKLNYKSGNKGLNALLNPISGYYDWYAVEVIEYLIFMDELDFAAACDILDVQSIRSINKTIKMEDVPSAVWDATYTKWRDALTTGWSSDLWHGCNLCGWINDNGDGCSSCPIYAGGWCVNTMEGSRLHREWCGDGDQGEYRWFVTVLDFLGFIKPYCNKKVKGD